MPRFRKGELNYYKKLDPIELNKYIEDHPENTEYVKKFLENYRYNWVSLTWVKGTYEL